MGVIDHVRLQRFSNNVSSQEIQVALHLATKKTYEQVYRSSSYPNETAGRTTEVRVCQMQFEPGMTDNKEEKRGKL